MDNSFVKSSFAHRHSIDKKTWKYVLNVHFIFFSIYHKLIIGRIIFITFDFQQIVRMKWKYWWWQPEDFLRPNTFLQQHSWSFGCSCVVNRPTFWTVGLRIFHSKNRVIFNFSNSRLTQWNNIPQNYIVESFQSVLAGATWMVGYTRGATWGKARAW